MDGAEDFGSSDALLESTFRRLLSAFASERDKLRNMSQSMEQAKMATAEELEAMETQTQEWCRREQLKIKDEWAKVNDITNRMKALVEGQGELIEAICTGQLFAFPKSSLSLKDFEGTLLATMFSPPYSDNLPKDSQGRYVLDINPMCFKIVVDHLQNLRLNPAAAVPVVPKEHRFNMDVLADALKLRMFMPENRMATTHSTSLLVRGSTVTAGHQGWQCITAEHPLTMARDSYFECLVERVPRQDRNPSSTGGICIGVIGHVPIGTEVHRISFPDGIMYNSGNGLVGEGYANEDVAQGVALAEGSTVGIRFQVDNKSVSFFLNRQPLGTAFLKQEVLENLEFVYPCLALFVPDTRVKLNFEADDPQAAQMVEVS
mmetsp:Transcript_26357/g.68133  ORF Transcript_26357/g.68133 Transcript_26357/m.68133 type:complete len:375 (+) Transcript_26357:21-1145(+)